MPGVPPNAISQLVAKVKGIFKSKKADKPTETTKSADTDTPTEAAVAEAATDPVAAAAAPEEATKTTDAAPATTGAVAETKAEEPIVAKEGEITVAKEETAAGPAVIADPEPETAPATEAPVENTGLPTETPDATVAA